MVVRPGTGVNVAAAIVTGALGLTTIVGLGVGLGLEVNEKSVHDSKLREIREEIRLAKDVSSSINITPPGGKGFIN